MLWCVGAESFNLSQVQRELFYSLAVKSIKTAEVMKVKITLLAIRCSEVPGPDPGSAQSTSSLLWRNGETYEMDNGDIIPEIMKTSPSHHHHIIFSLHNI